MKKLITVLFALVALGAMAQKKKEFVKYDTTFGRVKMYVRSGKDMSMMDYKAILVQKLYKKPSKKNVKEQIGIIAYKENGDTLHVSSLSQYEFIEVGNEPPPKHR